MCHCDGHWTLFFPHCCSRPPTTPGQWAVCVNEAVCACTEWSQAHLFSSAVIWMWGTPTGNPLSKSSLNVGCYFPGTEGNHTQVHTYIKLIVSKYMLCFPIHCVVFRDPLDLETSCISLDFISNGSIGIFHNYVKALSFCWLLAKGVKGFLPFHCGCVYISAVLRADLYM